MSINWIDGPGVDNDPNGDDDTKDASKFLSLIRKPKYAKRIVKKLAGKKVITYKAKDILRAAQLDPLPKDDPDVAEKLQDIQSGAPFQPVLLLRGDAHAGRPLVIADGYHRVSAAYWIDPTTDVDAQITHP